MVAGALGDIIILGEVTALYRRHPRAVSGSFSPGAITEHDVLAVSNNGENYAGLGRAMRSYAEYMINASLDCGNPTWRSDIGVAGERTEGIGNVLLDRAALYENTSFAGRMNLFGKLLTSGGYKGRQVPGMGLKSAMKDFAAVLGFF